jgi:hypothetical protein
MCFGGYVNGSRVNDVILCRHEGAIVSADHVCGGEEVSNGPAARASVSVGVYGRNVYMFGGQEDDNRKLNDIWSFDCDDMSWTQIEIGADDY